MDTIKPNSPPLSTRIADYQSKRNEWRQPDTYLRSKNNDAKDEANKPVSPPPAPPKKKINWLVVSIWGMIAILILIGLWFVLQWTKDFLLKVLH